MKMNAANLLSFPGTNPMLLKNVTQAQVQICSLVASLRHVHQKWLLTKESLS